MAEFLWVCSGVLELSKQLVQGTPHSMCNHWDIHIHTEREREREREISPHQPSSTLSNDLGFIYSDLQCTGCADRWYLG